MDNREIKRANRKALPKFVCVMLVCMIAGGCVGFFSAKYDVGALAEGLRGAGARFGMNVAPWLMLALAALVPLTAVPLYRRAMARLRAWDGEDAAACEDIDRGLNLVIWFTGAAQIVSLFLLAASNCGGLSGFEEGVDLPIFMMGVAAFFAILIEVIVVQQKCVDAVKRMNPEKTASVYDMKFHRKWLDSCDEAEKLMIGRCAFKAYAATNTACVLLATALALCALLFDVGFLPALAVCTVWFVNHTAYCRAAMRYAKAGIKLS